MAWSLSDRPPRATIRTSWLVKSSFGLRRTAAAASSGGRRCRTGAATAGARYRNLERDAGEADAAKTKAEQRNRARGDRGRRLEGRRRKEHQRRNFEEGLGEAAPPAHPHPARGLGRRCRVPAGGRGIEIVLASRRTRRGDLAWGLAKGGIEPGESREDAAVREVREETGLDATIEADLGDTKYIYVWEDVRIR